MSRSGSGATALITYHGLDQDHCQCKRWQHSSILILVLRCRLARATCQCGDRPGPGLIEAVSLEMINRRRMQLPS